MLREMVYGAWTGIDDHGGITIEWQSGGPPGHRQKNPWRRWNGTAVHRLAISDGIDDAEGLRHMWEALQARVSRHSERWINAKGQVTRERARKAIDDSIRELNELFATAILPTSMVLPLGVGTFWVYKDRWFYDTSGRLKPDEVHVLIEAKDLRTQKAIERAKRQVEIGAGARVNSREAIPDDVKIYVWQRDGGHCVGCDSNRDLEFDHVIPVTMGGSNTARNLQILCGHCNREKGANLV